VSAAHGDYVPGLGYYDAGLRAYREQPPKPAREMDARPPRAGMSRADLPFRSDHINVKDNAQANAANYWKPNDHHERLRRLRDSGTDRDQRIYARLSAKEKMTLGRYEEGLRAHIALGRPLPDGVRPPDGPSAA
jgi:hypothetical protein